MRAPWLARAAVPLVTLACVVFTLAAVWRHGADLNWDLRNYHLYAPHALMHGLLSRDFMPAGMMSYLNPLPLVPFYLMLKAGWPAVAIGMALGLVHALNLVLLWHICLRLIGGDARADGLRLPLAMLALILGAASPIFIAEIGTSYADITTCVPILAAVAVLLPRRERHAARAMLLGGALLGAAVGLKLTNLPFALAAGAFALGNGDTWRQRGANLGWLVAGGVAGGLLTGAWWAWELYREFGNPVFPFANGVFGAPDFPAVSHVHRRFLPGSWFEALTFPFQLMVPKVWIYTETYAPDLRFAMACIALLALAALALVRRRRRAAADGRGTSARGPFMAYVAATWILWLAQFANGRYFLPLALLIGPALVLLLTAMLSARRAFLVGVVCAFVQVAQMMVVGVHFYGEAGPWGEKWIDLEIPAALKSRPYLFLSLNILSASYVAPYLYPDSRFVNLEGMMPIDPDGPGGARVRRLIDSHVGNTQVLFLFDRPAPPPQVMQRLTRALDDDLNRFGLRVDPAGCQTITDRGLYAAIVFTGGAQPAAVRRAVGSSTILSCPALPVAVDPALQAQRAAAGALFDRVERQCPRQFPSRWNGAVLRTKDGRNWARHYVDTDLWLLAGEKYVMVQRDRVADTKLGTVAGLGSGAEKPACEQVRWHDMIGWELASMP